MGEVTAEVFGVGWSGCVNKSCLVLGLGSMLVVFDLKTLEVKKTVKLMPTTEIPIGNENVPNMVIDIPDKEIPLSSEEVSRGVIRRCDFLEETDIIGVGYFNGLCDIIDLRNLRLLDRLEGDESEIKSVSFSKSTRLGFSTREGSVWIWTINEDWAWEVEEIIEYSESDVKSILWIGDKLITVGYSNEVVVYNRWEADYCDIRWEIESIFKSDSCVWDVANDQISPYVAAVTQSGKIYVYEIKDSLLAEYIVREISEHPVIGIAAYNYKGSSYFSAVTDRRFLTIFRCSSDGLEERGRKEILSEYEEPVDILYSKEEESLYIISVSFQKRQRKTHIYKIDVKNFK